MTMFARLRKWLTEPESSTYVGWFRIVVAVFCLWKAWVFRMAIIELYGQYGYIQWAITRSNIPYWLPHLGNLWRVLAPYGVSADQTVHLVLVVHVLSLLAMLSGLFSRPMAFLAWCTDFLLMHAGGGLLYGMDYFTHIALFYCIIAPTSDNLSLISAIRTKGANHSTSAGVTRKMLQFQMSIVYLSSGIEKAMGIDWWTGESIWRALTLPIFSTVDVSWLSRFPWIPCFVGWSVLLIECGYGFAMYYRRTQKVWLFLTIGMHLGIGFMMGMWLFAAIMIILNCGAFGPECFLGIGSSEQSRSPAMEPKR